jgi:hypothetical protein
VKSLELPETPSKECSKELFGCSVGTRVFPEATVAHIRLLWVKDEKRVGVCLEVAHHMQHSLELAFSSHCRER